MTEIWNHLVNAFVNNDWHIIETAINCPVSRDNTYKTAHILANCITQQLLVDTSKVTQVTKWLLTQPYIHRKTFSSLIMTSLLPNNDTHHEICGLLETC